MHGRQRLNVNYSHSRNLTCLGVGSGFYFLPLCQAQADQQAEHMRRVVEERKRKRLAQQEEEAAKEHRGKEEGPRGKWVEPHELPPIAQQCETTSSVTEGKKQVSM